MKSLLLSAAVLCLALAACGRRGPVAGTFHKGPAVGGTQAMNAGVMTITGEKGFGSVSGGPFTGDAEYTIDKETVDFNSGSGTLRMHLSIKAKDGSRFTVAMEGATSGITQTAKTVQVSGTWSVENAEGPDATVRGRGTWKGDEDFQSGVTDGTFAGKLL